MNLELVSLWVAIVAYVIGGSLAIAGVILKQRADNAVLGLIVFGWGWHTAALGMRWERLGHGPFVTMFEILSSNVWSLTLVFILAYWRYRAVRPAAAVVMPILFMMMGWLMLVTPEDVALPRSFQTPWLYIHVGLGKVFLGAVLVAVGLSGTILLRRTARGADLLSGMPEDRRLEELAYRFIALGLVFESLMLIAGAIWAQDAWGRYWDWDPLETWSFLTWLLLAFTVHLRLTVKVRPTTSAVLIIAVFSMAFLTFFGVPFLSEAPHRGTF